MNPTEQMREALRKIKHEAVSLADAQVIALEALTAPAVEVPEAMGDERSAIERLHDTVWECIHDHGNGKHLGDKSRAQRDAAISALDRLRDAARLRAAAVPDREALAELFKDAMDWGRSYGRRLNLSDITVSDVSGAYADKAIKTIFIATHPTKDTP